MAKKIEVDIDYLKSIGLSQKQISDIIKKSEPDHWTNELPQDEYSSYELTPFTICPIIRKQGNIQFICTDFNPALSFFTEKDAEFIQNKCKLLTEMSNFSFAVNENWCPDWNNKDEKKYGIVLQNGQARVSENELFNLYVFGLVTRNRSLALEMLEEFKDRIETYFNKPFNSINGKIKLPQIISSTDGVVAGVEGFGTTTITTGTGTGTGTGKQLGMPLIGNINNTDSNSDFIGSFAPKYESASTRKKRKVLIESDIPKIQELLLNDVQQKDIAEKFDYSEATISQLKRKLGFKMCRSRIDE
jgi:hypothetical protein